MFLMHSRLFIAALWSPAGKGLTSWLLFVMFNCVKLSLSHVHGLQSRPPSPKRAERKVRRRPFREAGSGQNNGTR